MAFVPMRKRAKQSSKCGKGLSTGYLSGTYHISHCRNCRRGEDWPSNGAKIGESWRETLKNGSVEGNISTEGRKAFVKKKGTELHRSCASLQQDPVGNGQNKATAGGRFSDAKPVSQATADAVVDSQSGSVVKTLRVHKVNKRNEKTKGLERHKNCLISKLNGGGRGGR